MGFFGKIMQVLKRESAPQPSYIPFSPLRYVDENGRIQSADMMTVSAVFRCVSLISGSIASMPLNEQRRSASGVFGNVASSPLALALSIEPNVRTSAFDFWRAVVCRMLIQGRSYIVPRKDNDGRVLSFEQLSNDQVQADDYKGTYYINVPDLGFNGVKLTGRDILILRGMSTNGVTPLGLSTYASEAILMAAAGDNESRKRIENGGLPQLILKEAPTLGGVGQRVKDERQKVIDNTGAAVRRRDNAIFVPRGYEVTPVGYTAVDMQLQATREFAVKDICRFFNVPPSFAFADSAGNYKTVESAGIDFLVNCLDPILHNIENELRRKLIPREQWSLRRFEFDRSVRLAADSDSRAKYLTQLLGLGVTPNEIRRMLNLDRVDGGDTPLVSANLRNINEIKQNEGKTTEA